MWAVWSAVVAGVVAFFALGFVHWAAPLVAGGRLPRLVCYVLGLGVILVVMGIWCVAQRGALPAWWVWMAMCWVSFMGGLGTVAGWALDAVHERRVEEGVRRGQSRAEADRDC